MIRKLYCWLFGHKWFGWFFYNPRKLPFDEYKKLEGGLWQGQCARCGKKKIISTLKLNKYL